MANGRITSWSSAELTVPPAARLPDQFASDLDEAEQGTLAPCTTTTEETIARPIVDQRTLSNATSTSSNATTLIGQEPEREDVFTVVCQTTCGDDCQADTILTRLKGLVSGIGLVRSKSEKADPVFIKEHCDETYPLGWPRLAAFQNQSDSCVVYRRFGLLFCRILVQLQGELTVLEKKLLQLDKRDAENVNMFYRLRSSDDSETWDPEQRNILKQIQEKLSTYGDLLDKDTRLRRLGPAPERNHLNVYNWMTRHQPLEEGHDDFIFRKDDFITPTRDRGECNSIVDFIEGFISRWPRCPLRRLLGFSLNRHQDGEGTYFFSSRRIALAANIVIVCISISVLLIPVFVLYLGNTSRAQSSVVVLVSTLLFASLISLITAIKVENVFMSTCGYCAVLVVFLSNVQQQQDAVATVPVSGQG